VSAPFASIPSAAIDGERWLPVDGGGNQAEAPVAIRIPNRSEEVPNRFATAVPLAPRRHAVHGVLLELRHETIEIGGLPSLDVAIEQGTLLFVRYGRNDGPTVGKLLPKRVASARCKALFADASETSSNNALSCADHPNTSRNSKTARCRGGNCCIAAMKAS
jgi:hypothetical protein